MQIYQSLPCRLALYITEEDLSEAPATGTDNRLWIELAGRALETLGFRRHRLRAVECFSAEGGALLFVGLSPETEGETVYFGFDAADTLLDFRSAAAALPHKTCAQRLYRHGDGYVCALTGSGASLTAHSWLAAEFGRPLPAGPLYGLYLDEHARRLE